MQQSNFPNEVFTVSARPGAPGNEAPRVRITKIPARYSTKSAATMNGRRIALEKIGKFSIFAESASYTVVRGYARTSEEAKALGTEMIAWLRNYAEKRLEAYKKMITNLQQEVVVVEEDYRD